MTVITCFPCHENHLKKYWIQPSTSLQSHLGEKRFWLHKLLQSSKTRRDIFSSMNSDCGEDVENDAYNYGIVALDSVNVKDAALKIRLLMAGRRKNGQQKNGKQKKDDNGNRYERNRESRRNRRTSQGNGSSGMDGSGEGSGNGDESSDDDDDDCDDDDNDGEDEPDEEEEEEDEEEEDEDEMEEEAEEDTDNVSPIVEDDMEEATNGCMDGQTLSTSLELKRLEFENPGPLVASGTLEVLSSGDIKQSTDEDAMEGVMAPAVPGTPVTLSGVIWKETMGGVLVVNLKWRNKMYSGSLIDHSRYGWATPRIVDDAKESNMLASKRGKGKKGKHKGSAYTGNPLSPKMTGSGKRGPRFLHNKGKHGKDSFARPRAKRGLGSDTAEEGTRTRRRSCTVKTSISPSPSPTPLIECPERNCNKKYKHINGLRYHQAHAHLDNVADADEKDSDEDEETKSTDIKEPMSAHSKSSSSDDVKPLSRRKAKSQKSNSSNKSNDTVIPEEDSVENESSKSEKEKVEETGEKYDVTNIKIEPEEMIKTEEENGCTPAPNILQEAAKILFDEPSGPGSQDITFNTDVVHPGIFARMTSQAMMVTSNPGKYKYVSYEPMAESISGYSEKTASSVEVHEMGITIKEEVIEEGNAGMGKLTCKDQSDESLKLDSLEVHFNRERPHDRTIETAESDKTEWLIDKGIKSGNNNNTRKSTPVDGVAVTKDTNQLKTSAAEIRSLPGYQHFRVNSNTNFGSYVSPSSEEKESKTLEAGLGEAKESQKSGLNGDNGGTAKQQGSFETQENKAMVWKVQGAPATSSASFQLSCETKNLIRPGYISVASSKKPSARSVVTASTTWVPEVHPALMQKMTGGSLPGQEVLPEKPSVTPETADKARTAGGSCEEEEDEKTKNELGKFDDNRPKASFIGKPGRAVGVAHPFNTEKNEGEFALGSIGSFSSDPVKVLFSQSSSPKISLDLTHTDITEVKKVRVEKTLDVPVGEVIPLGKTSRSAVTATETRDAIIAGTKRTEHYSGIRATITDNRVSQPVDSISSQRDMNIQSSYIPAVAERSSPWRPASSYSPPRDSVPRSFRDHGQRYATSETSSPSRKVSRRSPVSEADRSPPFQSSASGYMGIDIGRRTPEKDAAERVLQRVTDTRLPFNNFDGRSSHRDKNTGMPFRDIGRSSPKKDTSGRVPLKGTGERSTYRDSDKRSSHGESSVSGRDCDRSPLRDNVRRSPGRDRRSPNREVVARASYRDTSPNPSNRDATRHSPYRETDRVKPARDDDTLTQRRDTRSPEERSRNIDSTRTHPSKSDAKPTKDVAELNVESQRMAADNKFSHLNEEEARMLRLRAPFYPYPTTPQDSATIEAMENYMMCLSRLQMRTMDPRFLQAYPMMPMLLQPQKETALPKEERTKKVPEETRNKSSGNKSETQRIRGLPCSESSDVELVVKKRHLDSGSSSSKGTEKAEYESSPSKRPKPSEPKDNDDRDGSRMQYRQLEQKVLHQQYQHKMDAFNQLQTEKNLKQKAEEKNSGRSKVSSGSNSSRLKPAMESRTPSKKEESIFGGSRSFEKEKVTSKDEKSRLSPATRPSINTASEGVQYRMTSRNSENKSPHGGTYPGFLTGANLPANHGLSNSYEQATLAMQGMPPFIMPAAFHHPPGIMLANSLVAGAEYHNAVTSRHLDSKRDSSRSSSTSTTTTDRGRTRDEEVHEVDTREYTSQTKKDVSSNSSKNTSSSPAPKPEVEKERGRERTRRTNEYDEGKQRTLRDNQSFQGSQNLPSNLAFRRGNMSTADPHFNQAFPHLMYPPTQGNFRPPFERPYIPYPRK